MTSNQSFKSKLNLLQSLYRVFDRFVYGDWLPVRRTVQINLDGTTEEFAEVVPRSIIEALKAKENEDDQIE